MSGLAVFVRCWLARLYGALVDRFVPGADVEACVANVEACRDAVVYGPPAPVGVLVRAAHLEHVASIPASDLIAPAEPAIPITPEPSTGVTT